MKRIVVVMASMLLVLMAHAQNIEWGIKAGMNLSGEADEVYQYTVNTSSKSLTGLALGGVVNFQLSHRFDLQADLMYSMQGKKDMVILMEGSTPSEHEMTRKVRSHYLNLPVALKFYLMDGLYIECGPQVGYLMSKSDDFQLDGDNNTFDVSHTKQVDFSLFGGIGLVFKNNVFVDARYLHGLTETSKLYSGAQNRNLQLVLGYYF